MWSERGAWTPSKRRAGLIYAPTTSKQPRYTAGAISCLGVAQTCHQEGRALLHSHGGSLWRAMEAAFPEFVVTGDTAPPCTPPTCFVTLRGRPAQETKGILGRPRKPPQVPPRV